MIGVAGGVDEDEGAAGEIDDVAVLCSDHPLGGHRHERAEVAFEGLCAVDLGGARREPARPEALQLVAFAKAYSGLSDAEFARVDKVIRATTLEKFGPVRSVVPSLVFELAFEGLNASPRHKSGIAVRFPRMLRIRDDKPLHEADSLQTLRALMAGGAVGGPQQSGL